MKAMDRSTFQYYQSNAGKLAHCYETADVKELHKRLLEIFSSGSKLLEIGCGSGREAAFLLSRGYKVYCIEPSLHMIEEALCYHPELEGRIFEGSVPYYLPEKIIKTYANRHAIEGEYDGIYAIASLMHLTKDQLPAALELLHSGLKPGGRLLFSVPLTRPDIETSGYDSKGRYFLLLPEEEWSVQLQTAGFSHIHTTTNPDGMGRDSVTWLTCIGEK